MSFMRPDTCIIRGLTAIDRNDPESAKSAIEYAVPDGFCEEAKAMMKELEGTAFIFAYKGKLVLTDETLSLTAYENDKPRIVCPDWDDLECWLTASYEDFLSEKDASPKEADSIG